MYCNNAKIPGCFDSDSQNNYENNAWNLEHNAIKLQEILNRIMQEITSIITSALDVTLLWAAVSLLPLHG